MLMAITSLHGVAVLLQEGALTEMANRWAEWQAGREAEAAAHATSFDIFRADVGGQVEDMDR